MPTQKHTHAGSNSNSNEAGVHKSRLERERKKRERCVKDANWAFENGQVVYIAKSGYSIMRERAVSCVHIYAAYIYYAVYYYVDR